MLRTNTSGTSPSHTIPPSESYFRYLTPTVLLQSPQTSLPPPIHPQTPLPPSRQSIPPINNRITPRLKRTRIRSQIQKQSFNLSYMSLSPQRCHPICFTLYSSCSAHFRVEEPRRNDVDASEISPFACERAAEVPHGGFGGVVDLGGEGVRVRWGLG